jgi:hypothetical protein
VLALGISSGFEAVALGLVDNVVVESEVVYSAGRDFPSNTDCVSAAGFGGSPLLSTSDLALESPFPRSPFKSVLLTAPDDSEGLRDASLISTSATSPSSAPFLLLV